MLEIMKTPGIGLIILSIVIAVGGQVVLKLGLSDNPLDRQSVSAAGGMVKAYLNIPFKHFKEINIIMKTVKKPFERRTELERQNIILGVLFRPLVLLGLALYFLSALVWLKVLAMVDLSIAYPMLALGYIFAYLAGVFIFREPVRWQGLVGIVIVMVGLAFIGSAMKTAQQEDARQQQNAAQTK